MGPRDGIALHQNLERDRWGPLLSELDAAPEMWLADTSRQRKVRCQRDTQNIFLPRREEAPSSRRPQCQRRPREPARAIRGEVPRALAFCQRIADVQRGELGRATLVALQPRGWVRPTSTLVRTIACAIRFHLVLKSSGGSPLTAGGETVVMHEGELWAFDNKAEHDARNPSDEPRLHLIFDVLPRRVGATTSAAGGLTIAAQQLDGSG